MGILDLLGISKLSKVKAELRANNLAPQATLLQLMKDKGYSDDWDEKRRDLEIKMLLAQKVDIMSAALSLDRFRTAREICLFNGLEDAANGFQNYIELYEYYIKNYFNLGGPSSW